MTKPFESPNINMTRDRSSSTIISHHKYANPLASYVANMLDLNQP